MNLLVVDNFDSFTYMLVDYLRQAGARCRVVRNDESWRQLTPDGVDGVVLSPGPGVPSRAGRLMDVIAHYHRRVPMLGVCLGHQAIGEFFGAKLVPAEHPMHGKVSTVQVLADDVLTRGLPTRFDVTRYHSLLLVDAPGASTTPAGTPERAVRPGALVRLAETDRGELMAFRHRTLPLWGVQFHPEAALTQYGLALLKNWVDVGLLTNRENPYAASLIAPCA